MRGCQKKIVYLKNTGSKIFDEAYFVISDRNERKGQVSDDMIAEANRIIEECTRDREKKGKTFLGKGGSFIRAFLSFVLGAVISGGAVAVIFTIFI